MDNEIKKAFPLKRIKPILEKNEKKFTDKQMIEIRDFLIELAKINYLIFKHNEKDDLNRFERKKTKNPS